MALGVGSSLSACGSWYRPSPIPIDVVHTASACGTPAPMLLVILPGAFMTADELLQHGFVDAVRARSLAVDVRIPEPRMAQVYDGSVFTRLRDDVFVPARAAGYRRIWVMGISLGAYLALQHARVYPGEIEGIVALAPYLGRRTLIDEIAAAGGVAHWTPTTGGEDVDRDLWRWIATRDADAPAIDLGAGSEDRFATAHRLFASTLPAQQVTWVPGGHDWPPWRALWAQWLDRGRLPGGCAR